MTRIADLIDESRAALNRDDVAAADALAREALTLDSHCGPALHIGGVIAARLGGIKRAFELLHQAISVDRTNVLYLHDFAELCYRVGQLDAAGDSLTRAIELAPTRPDLPIKLGFVLLQQGRHEAAIKMVHRALAHPTAPIDELTKLAKALLGAQPELASALHAAGLVEMRGGRPEYAIDLLRQAVLAAPDSVDYWHDLGQLYFQLNQQDAAANALSRAIEQAPKRADLHVKLALVRLRQQQPDEAETLLRRALTIKPGSLDAQVNLANLLSVEGNDESTLDEARRLYEKVLVTAPDNPLIHSNYGNLLARLGRSEDAISRYLRALRLAPENLEARINLAQTYHAQGQLDEAETLFRDVLQRQPNHAAAHRGLGHILLARGQLADGWREYHYRFFVDADEGRLKIRPFRQPWWFGEPLAGRRVLAWAEQGIGEEIMYAGLLPELAGEAEGVVIECDTRLVRLYARSFLRMSVVGRQTPPAPRASDAAIDFQCAFGAIAGMRLRTFDSFPKHGGYLIADTAKRDAARAWLDRLGTERIKVGISWFSDNRLSGGRKSTPLRLWSNLLRRPDVAAVDLQYGDTEDERSAVARQLGIVVHRHPDIEQLVDLDGFAGLVSALDLVITISNTTAHMAGALGKPCWVLLHDVPFWHWFLDRDDSPWYPSVRLFRQRRPGDWTDVFNRVEAAFDEWVDTSNRA